MKKVIATCAFFILVMAGKTFAQGVWKTSNGGRTWSTANQPEKGTVDFKLTQGENSVKVPRGTVKFFIDGVDRVTNVVFLDLLGRATQMSPAKGGTNGAPKPECKYKLPDACFSSPDKSIGLCICRPDALSGAARVSYQFQAVQAATNVRDGAQLQVQGGNH